MTYDNIKSHKKKQGFALSLEDTFFKKPQGELTPPPSPSPPAVLGLRVGLTRLDVELQEDGEIGAGWEKSRLTLRDNKQTSAKRS